MIVPTSAERRKWFFPVYQGDVKVRFCGDCNHGAVYLDALEHGWKRMPEWDTPMTDGYMTPGGQRFNHEKGQQLLTYTLCNCVRRANGWQPRVVFEAQEDGVDDRESLDRMLKTRRAG